MTSALGEKLIELGEGGGVGLRRVVGVDTGAGEEARHARLAVELATNIEGLVHFARPLADADGEHCAHSCRRASQQHFGAVVVVARTVEVGMGIDEQSGLLQDPGSDERNAAPEVHFTKACGALGLRGVEKCIVLS